MTPGIPRLECVLPEVPLAPGEARILRADAHAFRGGLLARARPPEAPPPRIIIESIRPEVDGGRFPVKRVVGDRLVVSAALYRDGHERIAGVVRWRDQGQRDWAIAPLRPVGEDRWSAEAHPRPHRPDPVRLRSLDRRVRHVGRGHQEKAGRRPAGRRRTGRGAGVAPPRPSGPRRPCASGWAPTSATPTPWPATRRPRRNSSPRAWCSARPRSRRIRPAASSRRSGRSWSTGRPPASRPGTRCSRAARARCRAGAPRSRTASAACPKCATWASMCSTSSPIHPIGEINRKGRNNRPRRRPAIREARMRSAAALGGHTAVDPGLGTLEDFRRLQRAARAHGLEMALDFAVQCAPDHPWLSRAPGLVPPAAGRLDQVRREPAQEIPGHRQPRLRPAGLARRCGRRCCGVVLFWVAAGRAHLPRRQPAHQAGRVLGMADRARCRGTIRTCVFLAEAFTRPKMMRRLAKAGFTQSYTYFTWRNTKAELTEYLTELTPDRGGGVFPAEFLRQHARHPARLPAGRRPGRPFASGWSWRRPCPRPTGSTTASSSARPPRCPAGRNTLDSEKYEFKVWDWDRPGTSRATSPS